MRVVLSVTETHIVLGRPNCGNRCPVALALRDSIPDLEDVQVEGRYIAIRTTAGPLRALVPTAAVEFINDFDCTNSAEPTSFVLDFEPSDPTA